MRYEYPTAEMYSPDGRLDYRLKAQRLFLQDDKMMKVVMPEVTVASLHGASVLKRSDLGEGTLDILSDRAVLSNNRLYFLDHVMMKAHICTQKHSDCALPILVKSNQLEYRLKDQFFWLMGMCFIVVVFKRCPRVVSLGKLMIRILLLIMPKSFIRSSRVAFEIMLCLLLRCMNLKYHKILVIS